MAFGGRETCEGTSPSGGPEGAQRWRCSDQAVRAELPGFGGTAAWGRGARCLVTARTRPTRLEGENGGAGDPASVLPSRGGTFVRGVMGGGTCPRSRVGREVTV